MDIVNCVCSAYQFLFFLNRVRVPFYRQNINYSNACFVACVLIPWSMHVFVDNKIYMWSFLTKRACVLIHHNMHAFWFTTSCMFSYSTKMVEDIIWTDRLWSSFNKRHLHYHRIRFIIYVSWRVTSRAGTVILTSYELEYTLGFLGREHVAESYVNGLLCSMNGCVCLHVVGFFFVNNFIVCHSFPHIIWSPTCSHFSFFNSYHWSVLNVEFSPFLSFTHTI